MLYLASMDTHLHILIMQNANQELKEIASYPWDSHRQG